MFTIDENKIFSLANRYGARMNNLPKPNDYAFANEVNDDDISMEVINAVLKFERKKNMDLLDYEMFMPRAYRDYIIYLTDIIDRLYEAFVQADKELYQYRRTLVLDITV
ncbi:MAG: hypothetical protein IJ175_07830 [Clostridia bacterium]|nr:hypothetical protein [Clostridia bacterium]